MEPVIIQHSELLMRHISLSNYFDENRDRDLIEMDTNYNLYVCKFILYYELFEFIINGANKLGENENLNSFSSMENGPIPREYYSFRKTFLESNSFVQFSNYKKSINSTNIDYNICNYAKIFIESNSNLKELIQIGHNLDFWRATPWDEEYYFHEKVYMDIQNISKSDIDTIKLSLELIEEYPHKYNYNKKLLYFSNELNEIVNANGNFIEDSITIPSEFDEYNQIYIGIQDGVLTYE